MTVVRAAAHVHSEWSYDAAWSLPALARAFSRRGYGAVLMAEHDRTFDQQRWRDYTAACAAASLPGLVLVPGIEYADLDDVVHIPVWGDVPFLGSRRDTTELLRSVREAGGFSVLAHPARRAAWERVDPEWLNLLSGLEVWNRKYDGWAPSRDVLDLARQRAATPFASLDFHGRRQFFPLGMALEVDGHVTRAGVEQALLAGRARPLFAGQPVEGLAAGVPGAAARVLEGARRRAARYARAGGRFW